MEETQLPAVEEVTIEELLRAWIKEQGVELVDSEDAYEYVLATEVTLTRAGTDEFQFNTRGAALELSADYDVVREEQ